MEWYRPQATCGERCINPKVRGHADWREASDARASTAAATIAAADLSRLRLPQGDDAGLRLHGGVIPI